jgi:hypothetical protein
MLNTGPKTITIEKGRRYRILADSNFYLEVVTGDGEIVQMFSKRDNTLRFNAHHDGEVKVNIKTTGHFAVESDQAEESVSSIPIEIPEEMKFQETMEDKMRKFVYEMVRERYGDDSDQMETLEESMDFDMDGDDEPLSGYEIQEMIPEEPIEAQTDSSLPSQEAQDAPTDPGTDAENPPSPAGDSPAV